MFVISLVPLLPHGNEPVKKVGCAFHAIFYFLCSVTGQLAVYPSYSCTQKSNVLKWIVTVWSTIWLIIFLAVNAYSLVFDLYVIIHCPYTNCGYIYTPTVSQWSNLSNHTVLDLAVESVSEYEDWQKVVITTATLSGLVSYYLLVFCVLIPKYSVFGPLLCNRLHNSWERLWHHCGERNVRSNAANQGRILNPFLDWNTRDPNNDTSTSLSPMETMYFQLIFWINILLFLGNVVTFFIIFHIEDAPGKANIVDISGLTAQFGSQLCAILSCFIFAKVAYAVSSECSAMVVKFKEVDKPSLLQPENVPPRIDDHQPDRPPTVADPPHTVADPPPIATDPSPTVANPPLTVTDPSPGASDSSPQPVTFHRSPAATSTTNPQPLMEDQLPQEITNPLTVNLMAPQEQVQLFIHYLERTTSNNENRARRYFMALKEKDKEYVHMVHNTLQPYGTWFAFHWVLYTITAFMSIAYLAETVVQELYGHTHKECHGAHSRVCKLDLAYITLFTLEHSILFLYPCFRAAAVTSARTALIKKVSETQWNHIPETVILRFVQYLKAQKCGFKISILCARLQFGFNIAYISIFLAVFGVVLKLSL